MNGVIVLHRPTSMEHGHFEHRIDIAAGAFRGAFNGACYGNAYGHFRDQLAALHEKLSGEASLGGYENLTLHLRGDGRGHIEASVVATDDWYRDIRLNFRMHLDQTQLPAIIDAIDATFLSRDRRWRRRRPASSGHPAAIDHQVLARDERRLVGGEE